MEKYTRADNTKNDERFDKNEIRVTTQGKMRRYISYATTLLQEPQDPPVDRITLKAMGKAINKTVAIAEIIKRRIPGLHQITEIDSTDIQETYNPNEEGLDVVQTTRHVSSIMISLFTKEPDTTAVGYQPPISETEVKPLVPRGKPKSTKADRQQPPPPQNEEHYANPPADNPPRSRGARRGRGRRGGGYGYPPRQGYRQDNNRFGGQYESQGGFGGQQYEGKQQGSYGGQGYDSRQQYDGRQQGSYGGQGQGYDSRQQQYDGRQQGGYGGQGQGYGQGYHRGYGRRGGFSRGRRGFGGGGRRQNQSNQQGNYAGQGQGQ